MLAQLFERCGLNDSEQRVMLFLLSHGGSRAARLARGTGLKRPTVYAALQSLVERGLVIPEKQRAVTVFRAITRSSIPRVLEQHALKYFEEVRQTTSLLKEKLAELPEKEAFHLAGFQISTINSPEAVYAHLEEVLNRGDFAAIFDPQLIPDEQLKGVVKRFLQNTSRSKPRIREIATKGPATRWYRANIQNKNHKMKELPEEYVISSDLILLDGEVVVSNYQADSELAVRIREPNLYKTLLTVFDILWAKLP